MKASELRIGNWIYNNAIKANQQVTVHTLVNMVEFDAQYEPIPLTEEWLADKTGYSVVFLDSNLWVSKKNDGNFYTTDDFDDKISFYPIYHVHQLQNLYFALTGEELELK
jgi:hypothetical protein